MIDGDDKMSLGARQLMIRALWRKETMITHEKRRMTPSSSHGWHEKGHHTMV